jgi:hypothetical protein
MTLDQLIDEYKKLPKVCALTNYADIKTVAVNNKAVERMYEIVSSVAEFGPDGVQKFADLLDISEHDTKVWAATHFLEKLSFDELTGRRALNIIETVANGRGIQATGYKLWLKDFKTKNLL